MKTQVLLPTDPLIDYYLFCKAIAQARHPTGEQGLKGMDCIVGKMVTHHVPQPYSGAEEDGAAPLGEASASLSNDGRPLNQLHADQPAAESSTSSLAFGGEGHQQMEELTLPYQLTDDDRQQMEKLLAHLPALHYPMSEEERAGFMSAYFSLPNRPAWEPVLITAATIERRKAEQNEVMRHHQKAIQDAVARGRLMAVNADHVPVTRLSVRDFLPRDQAIAYLTRCGMTPVEQTENSHPDAKNRLPSGPEESFKGKQGVGGTEVKVKDKRELFNFREDLRIRGAKDFTKQTAQEFGITDRRVREIVAEVEDEMKATGITVRVIKPR